MLERTLVLQGDAAADMLALCLRPGPPGRLEVDVRDGGRADFRVARSTFARVRVEAGDGSDEVRIDASEPMFTDEIRV